VKTAWHVTGALIITAASKIPDKLLQPPSLQERGRNNFTNYASQLQATFARFQITKILKQPAIPSTFVIQDRTNLTQICAPT